MRSVLRVAGLAFVAAVAITCTDAPTSPSSLKQGIVPGRLTMSPSFSPEAAKIYGRLASFGLDITEVHVRLTAADGSTRDTVIAFPPGQDELVIEIPVSVTGTDQAFNALIELRNDQHTVLFSGTQTVIARAANLPPLTPPVVTINYTGPGKGTKTVTVSPPDTAVAANAAIPFSATAIDSSNKAVTDLLVGWTISDATLGTVTPGSNISATITGLGKRGVATVTATTPQGVAGSSRITFIPPPSRLIVVSGGGQTGVAGSSLLLPMVVELQATDNLPVPGARVNFRAVTSGGAVQTATVTSDANGRASTLLTLGRTAGTYQYEASSGTLSPVTVSATSTPAPAAAIALVSGDNQVDSVGRALPQPLVVKVTDQFGGDVSGATVTWTRIAGNGALSAASSVTGATGTASVNYTLGSTPSSDTVRASVSGVTGTVLFAMKAINRAPGSITIIAGGGQSGAPGTTLPTALVARVRDAQNNPIAGQTVVWSASGAGVTFAVPSSATDASGLVTTAVTLGSNSGATVVMATAGSISASTQLTTTAGPAASITKTAGDLQSAAAGSSVPVAPSVTIRDAANNPVANAPVVFAVASGGGSVTGGTTTTNAAGVATVGSWTLGATAGANSLTATSGSLVATFTATATAAIPAKLLMSVQPPASAVSGVALVPAPVVQIADAGGNPVAVANVNVTATMASGSATPSGTLSVLTDAQGKATFSNLILTGAAGTNSLQFSSGTLAGISSNSITLGAGAPANMVAITPLTQTGVAGGLATSPPGVKITDAAGNPVAGVGVNFGISTPGAGTSLSDGITTGQAVIIPTNASGVAQLTAWTLRSIAGNNRVGAVPQVTQNIPTIFFDATGTAGPSAKISLVNPVPASITVGQTFTPVPAQLVDANDNPVAQAGVVITATGNVQPSNTTFALTATTNASGTASFNPLPYTGKVGTLTFTLTAPNVAALVTSPISVLTGPLSRLVVATHAQPNVVSGAVLSPQPAIQLADVGGNPVALASVQVFAALQGNGSLTGTPVVVTNASGVATFTNLAINAPSGPQVLQYTGGGLTPTADTVVVTANAPASLAKLAGDGQVAPVGSALPTAPSVRVLDATGAPVVGATVTFAIGSGGGSVTGATPVTNNLGVATVGSWVLGTTAGGQTLTATAGSATTTFNATATAAGPAAHVLTVLPPATATSGVALSPQPQVQLKDAFNNNVPQSGVVVTATPSVGGMTATGNTATTNASGLAVFSGLTISGPAGAFSLQFSSSAAPTISQGMTLAAGAASSITKTAGDGQNAAVGSAVAVAPQVQVKDASGNPVSGVGVTFAVASGGGSVTGPTATTNASGLASVGSWTLGTTAGPQTLTATAGSLSATFNATAVAGPAASFQLLSVLPVGWSVGTVPPPFQFQLVDAQGNAVQQSGVTANAALTVQPSNQSVSATAVSNASGIVTVSFPAYNGTQGTATFTVAATGLTTYQSPSIAITTGPAAALKILTQPGSPVAAGAVLSPQPALQIVDVGGNNVSQSGMAVVASIASGTGGTLGGTTSVSTNSAGQALFTNLSIGGQPGTFTLSFANSGNTVVSPATNAITVSTGNTTTMSINAGNGQSATTGTAVAIAPSVKVVDQFNNPVAGVVVTFNAGTSGSTVSNGGGQVPSATVTTNALGVAALTNWTMGASATTYSLTVTAAVSSGSPLTFTATATPAGPASVTVNSGGQTVAVVGTTAISSGNITFAVKDAAGSPVPNGTSVSFASNSTLCTPTSSTSTTSLGVASVGFNLSAARTGGCVITATAGSASGTAKIAVTPTTASHVWFGGAASNVHAFDLGANWIQRSNNSNTAPALAANIPFVPNYNDGLFPQAQSAKTFAGLIVDSLAMLDLNALQFTSTGNVGTSFGLVLGGTMNVTGVNASVAGQFSTLVVGGGTCGGAAPQRAFMTRVHVTAELTVRCSAVMDTVSANDVATVAGSKIDVRDKGLLVVLDTAYFVGDSLNLINTAVVSIGGAGRFGGALRVDSASQVSVQGNGIFTGNSSNLYGSVVVVGSATFGGAVGTNYHFTAGQLVLGGNFSQVGTGSVFTATANHLTSFFGSAPVTMNFADPTNSLFGNVQIGVGTDVTATSDVLQALANGSPLLDIYGKLTIPTGKTWNTPGFVQAITGSTTTVNGAISAEVFNCNGGAVVGSGTINGTPANQRCILF